MPAGELGAQVEQRVAGVDLDSTQHERIASREVHPRFARHPEPEPEVLPLEEEDFDGDVF